VPSFDIVSEVDLQEVDNAVNQTTKEITQRFDFRGSKANIEFDKIKKSLKIVAEDDLKLRAIRTLLEQKFAKRGVDLRSLDFGAEEPIGGNMLRQDVELKAGLSKEDAKEITKAVKEWKLKVTAEIQDDQVRVTGKNIDDLQTVIAKLKAMEFKFPLQYINMRR
jgi:cyclic-di-GMP-binding protein